MNFVMSRKDECNPACLSARPELAELIPMSANLIGVSSSKFLPAGGIMPKPIAQHGTGRDALIPLIDSCVRFADAPGP
jgi:hypothetical protein